MLSDHPPGHDPSRGNSEEDLVEIFRVAHSALTRTHSPSVWAA